MQFSDADILQNNEEVTGEITKSFVKSELEQYRVIQNGLHLSDFDLLIARRNNG